MAIFGVAKMPSCVQFDSNERRLSPPGINLARESCRESIHSGVLGVTSRNPRGVRRLGLVILAQVVATLVSAVKHLGIGARFVEVPQIRTGSVIAYVPLNSAPRAGITKAHAHGTSSYLRTGMRC